MYASFIFAYLAGFLFGFISGGSLVLFLMQQGML